MKIGQCYIAMRYFMIYAISCTIVKASVLFGSGYPDDGVTKADEDTYAKLQLKQAGYHGIDILNQYVHTVPVNHFARHGLCRHEKGRQYFYTAIKSRLCEMKESFVAMLVEDLCKNRGRFLDKWVSELFDIDGNGFLTHFEKRMYEK